MDADLLCRYGAAATMIATLVFGGYHRTKAHRVSGRLQGPTHGPGILALRIAFVTSFLTFILACAFNPASVSWGHVELPILVRLMGLAVAAFATPTLFWVFISLGQNISPTAGVRDGHKLVTTGPYRWIRHPLYTLGFLLWFSISLALSSWLPALIATLGLVGVAIRLRKEEANLLREFGDAYREYASHTGRFIPKLF